MDAPRNASPHPAPSARPHICPPLPRTPRRRRRRRPGHLVGRRTAAAAAAFVLAVVSLGGSAIAAGANDAGGARVLDGRFADGATWRIETPAHWNGTLALYNHGLVPPGQPNEATDSSDPLSARYLLEHGVAVAGSSFATTGWAVEDGLRDQLHLLDVFEQRVGRPAKTVTWGDSMGGLMAITLAERHPGRIAGALSMCGLDAGAVALWNSYLDVLFTLRTLVAPDAHVELTDIGDPFGSLDRLQKAMTAAQKTAKGRARLALAAAVGDIPGWVDADAPEPAAEDVATQELNQFRTMRDTTAVLGLLERAEFEARAGGNPGFNTGVDYADLLRRSTDRREVERLYQQAGGNLGADLQALAATPRIPADPGAVRYLERFASFTGDLDRTPVLTLHNQADPLAPVENDQAYLATVRASGKGALLRRAFVHRAGHCTFTPAEKMASLQALIRRIDHGRWDDTTDAAHLEARAKAFGPGLNVALGDDGDLFPVAPAFTTFTPGPYLRPYDLAGA